jgi:50S ribosomal protein L16 3-hydroxylase
LDFWHFAHGYFRLRNPVKNALLGGLSPRAFLRKYWQKKPLLIRGAFPGFTGLLSPEDLKELACRDDAQARLINQKRDRWQVRHGPFMPRSFLRLPPGRWTLLVQDVNHFLPSARELLLKFNFIPHARLDDLMVSYAAAGGGVGPHFDSYDVFLLQGMGRRRWQISAQQDRTLIADAPLKILQDFRPEQEWLLEPGDMLYLPPGYAHNGIAEEHCMTYSIGFRAPSYQELTVQFLVHLQDHSDIKGMYGDPDLAMQRHPGRIHSAMLRQTGAVLNKIKWRDSDIECFLGAYLTEPKPHVFFTPPAQIVSLKKFIHRIREGRLTLNLKSRMLLGKKTVFLNGETYPVTASTRKSLEKLADTCVLPSTGSLGNEATSLCYEWYTDGFIDI